jgi:amino acid permease
VKYLVNCKNHPEIEAAGFCTKCGNFFCDECLTFTAGKNYCYNCLTDVVAKGEKPSEPQVIVQQQQQQTVKGDDWGTVIAICCILLIILVVIGYVIPK